MALPHADTIRKSCAVHEYTVRCSDPRPAGHKPTARASRYSRWSQVAWRESRATDQGCTAPPSAIPPTSGLRSSYRTPTAPPLRRGVGLAGSPTRKGFPARAGTPSTPHSLRSCGQTMALGCQPTIAESLQDWGRDSRLSAPQEAPPKARPIDSTNSQGPSVRRRQSWYERELQRVVTRPDATAGSCRRTRPFDASNWDSKAWTRSRRRKSSVTAS